MGHPKLFSQNFFAFFIDRESNFCSLFLSSMVHNLYMYQLVISTQFQRNFLFSQALQKLSNISWLQVYIKPLYIHQLQKSFLYIRIYPQFIYSEKAPKFCDNSTLLLWPSQNIWTLRRGQFRIYLNLSKISKHLTTKGNVYWDKNLPWNTMGVSVTRQNMFNSKNKLSLKSWYILSGNTDIYCTQ